QPPRGVHRDAPRDAPVLRRDPGASGVPVPADAPAPAVHRPDRRGPGPLARRRVRPRHPRGRDSMSVEDAPENWPVESTTEQVKSWLLSVRTDQVRFPDNHSAKRIVASHPGAVAVVALDDDDRVLMIRQYRHPVGRLLWEIPAGLRDVDGEPLLD